MQLRFFSIPILGGEQTAEALNRFLAGHRILAVDRQLTQDAGVAVWAICVSYEPAGESRPQGADQAGMSGGRRGKVDYREVLDEADFNVYARLRSLRKEMAEKDGVPLYALFTNDHMAEMVTRRVTSKSDLREIPGIGAARVEKYGAAFLETLRAALAEMPAAEPPVGDEQANGQRDEETR